MPFLWVAPLARAVRQARARTLPRASLAHLMTWKGSAHWIAVGRACQRCDSTYLVEIAGGPQVLPSNPRLDVSPAPVVVHVLAAGVCTKAAGMRHRRDGQGGVRRARLTDRSWLGPARCRSFIDGVRQNIMAGVAATL